MEDITKTPYVVKIVQYMPDGYHAINTLYYRYRLPWRLVQKYKWYWQYLCALAVMKQPNQLVELLILKCNDNTLAGEDWIKAKLPSKLKGRKAALTKLLNTPYELDLFGFADKERDEKISQIKKEIAELEQGIWRYYVPDTYLNKIHIKSTKNAKQ